MASITNFTTKLDATNKSEFSQCEDGCDYDGSDWDRLADNLRAAIADTALPLVMVSQSTLLIFLPSHKLYSSVI